MIFRFSSIPSGRFLVQWNARSEACLKPRQIVNAFLNVLLWLYSLKSYSALKLMFIQKRPIFDSNLKSPSNCVTLSVTVLGFSLYNDCSTIVTPDLNKCDRSVSRSDPQSESQSDPDQRLISLIQLTGKQTTSVCSLDIMGIVPLVYSSLFELFGLMASIWCFSSASETFPKVSSNSWNFFRCHVKHRLTTQIVSVFIFAKHVSI